MSFKETILKKREGGENSAEEIHALVEALLSGNCLPEQMSAWLMAVYFKGLSNQEMSALTEVMWKTGKSLPRPERKSFWIDKHSTGGVGDKTSLLLIPIVIAASQELWGTGRVQIPMISGRGLAHTGGTLDKLESIPGFQVNLAIEKALPLLEQQDFFMMGQTVEVAPADRLIYAMRDRTSTVECHALIVASIMSKKLSENLDGLIFDVKFGSGATTKNLDGAKILARSLVEVANRSGVRARACLSPMEEPLGWKVGHAMEIDECADFFEASTREPRMEALVFELAANMLFLASGEVLSVDKLKQVAKEVCRNGKAKGLFVQMLESQGGDFRSFQSRPKELPVWSLRSEKKGYVSKLDALAIGKLVQSLAFGIANSFDPEVGVEMKKKVGDSVGIHEELLQVRYRDAKQLSTIAAQLKDVAQITEKFVESLPQSFEWI